jgi:hypothetical protein
VPRARPTGGCFCPRSWDDEALADPVAAAVARRCRELSRIPGQVRHTEKWRLALEMITEMTVYRSKTSRMLSDVQVREVVHAAV